MYAPGQTPALSDWIDGSVKPTIVGVYQRDYTETQRGSTWQTAYSLFDGVLWHSCDLTVFRAACNASISPFQSIPWRGLRYDPALSKGHAS